MDVAAFGSFVSFLRVGERKDAVDTDAEVTGVDQPAELGHLSTVGADLARKERNAKLGRVFTVVVAVERPA